MFSLGIPGKNGMVGKYAMVCQTFTHQIWWVMACYDLAHQIRCAKHTFRGWCDITPMVCCSFGGHSTPQFLQCILIKIYSTPIPAQEVLLL